MMPSRLGASAVALAVAAPLCAQQLSVTAVALQPAVSAQVAACSQGRSIPLGAVTAPTRVEVAAPCTYFGESARAHLGVTPSPHSVQIDSGTQTYSASAIPAHAAAAAAFDIDVQGDVSGVLEVEFSFAMRAASPAGWLRVDVGADGTHEVDVRGAGPHQGTIRVPIQVTGRLRSTATFSIASSQRDPLTGSANSAVVRVELRLVPADAVTFVTDGVGCGAVSPLPTLTGRDLRTPLGHAVELQVDHAIPSGFVALVFATRPADQPIGLPPGCRFLVEPQTGTFVPTDAAGRATLRIDLGPSLPAATLHAQAVPFDFTPRAWASGRLQLTLWP